MKTQMSVKSRPAGCLATAIIALIAAPAWAGTCAITTTNEIGTGSLRERLSNSACSEITFSPDIVPGTIELTTAGISIFRDLTIAGPGADKMTIRRRDGTAAFRIFTILAPRVVTISGVTIANGSVFGGQVSGQIPFGGGIFNSGTLTITDSTIANNSISNGNGGGVAAFGHLTLDRTTFTGNSSSSGGGGVYLGNSGVLTVINSTISANSTDFRGGGIGMNIGGSATITNSTIAGNSGGGIDAGGVVRLQNTIVANNPGFWNCNIFETIDGGGNLAYPDTSCRGLNADPLLGPLADNGSPTRTMSLLTGSPALHTGVPANCPLTDQRGVTRHPSGGCDAGAVEATVTFACPVSAAQPGAPYTSSLAASGGQSPYTWSIAAGSLPEGFTFDGLAGTISGTQTATGTSIFTVKMVDSSTIPYNTATNNCFIAVDATPPVITPTSPTLPSTTGFPIRSISIGP